ncbi:uncharacterized protein LOC135499300 isoform X2 [Lineus longissimus]|uniref:uncharacterized protein LOC135499300 isoform X2 n=1 Tax=Lineus longissimus TaxID=88925 RepID=UPI002B4E7768
MADFINVYNNYLKTFVDKGPAYLARAAAVLEYDGDTEDTFGRPKVKTPTKSKSTRSKMASNKNGSHDNGPPGGSAADSANNNNIRNTGRLTSQLSTETEGTLSTCSTLDRYIRGEDRHVSNSDFEDMCKANDLSDTDTLTGSPHVRSPVAPNGKFPSTGLNIAKDFISPGRQDDQTDRHYLQQLEELINEPLGDQPEQISASSAHDTIGQINLDYFAQLEASTGPPKGRKEGRPDANGRNRRHEDISARVDHDTRDLLAQLEGFGPRPPMRELDQTVQDTIGGMNLEYPAELEEGTISVTSVQDTIGLPNLDYLAQLEGKQNGNRHQASSRLNGNDLEGRKLAKSPVQKTVINTATGNSPERSPVFTRRTSGGILNRVQAFEKRMSGGAVKEDTEIKAIEKEYEDYPGFRDLREFEEIREREAEERLDSLGPEEDEEERNKSVRDAIGIFERFKSSLGQIKETPRPAGKIRPDACEKQEARPDAHGKSAQSAPKQDAGSRPALRPQLAFERSFDLDSSSVEQKKQKVPQSPKKEDRDSRLRQGQYQKVQSTASGVTENNSDRSRVIFRSSSADRFSDPNRQNLSKKRDVSPRFSPQNAADPEDEKRRLKNRSQSGDRIRPKSEYRAQEERSRRGQETYVSFAKDRPRPRGRQSRKDERGRTKDRNADRFVKSDPEFTNTSDEMEQYHEISPIPPRDELKRRSGFERHLEQPPLSPVKEVRPISGHYDNQLSPPPPFDPRRRSGSYERQPALIVSPQPGERRSESYDRPQSGMVLSPHQSYPDLKRWSGNYDRQGRPEVPQPGPPNLPVRAMPRVPQGFERDYRIPPYRDLNQYPERRDSPRMREDRGSPYMHEHGPGSPRCFSPQQRPYGDREGSPRCFSPRQWPNQEREGGCGSPHFSPHHRHEGYHQRQEDDPIYARVQKTNRPYYGPPEPGTYYMHDRPEQWQRSLHYDYEQRYYESRSPAFRYPPYQGYPQDPYMRYPQDYTPRDWEYQDRSPYSMSYPPPLEVCPYHHPTDPRSYHDPISPKNTHQNEPRSYHEQLSPKNLHHTDSRGYQEPLSPKHMHQDLKTPYDNVDNLGPLRHIPQHVRGTSPTGYHSDDPMYLRKMNDYVHRQQTQLSQQQTQRQERPQLGDSRNFYSDFHPGDPYCQEQEQKDLERVKEQVKPREWKYGVDSNFQADPYRPGDESTEWKYANKQEEEENWKYGDGDENEGAQTTDSAFHLYLPDDDPFAQLNPTTRAPDLAEIKHGQIGSFDSDMIPSYSDLPDQEAVQSQDPLDQYMSPPRQMKLRPKHVKKETDAKKVAPLAVRLDTHFDRSDTMRSTSTNTSTLKSFATDTIGSSKSWGKYDPFVNPSAFAPELGLELMPNWKREDRDKTPTRSGPPPQRSLSDPSETESSKGREIRPYGRSRTSPGAVPNITVNSPSPAGQTKGTNMNRDVWMQLEARHPQRVPPATSSSNLSKIEIASSVVSTKATTPSDVEKTNSWQYNKGSGEAKEPKGALVERDILKEKGVFFSQPNTDASKVKKNFDEIRGPELSRKKLIYRKSNSDTRIPINGKPERPKTLNIQHEFSKPDADLKRMELSRFRDHCVKQLTDSALAVKCDTGHVEVKRELRELSSSRGAKIAGIKSTMFDANGKREVMIHPLPVKSQNIPLSSTSFKGSVSYSQGLAGDEYLINVTKETKVKKTPFIQDHLAELEGLFADLDLDNENLLANAERQELKVNLLTQGDNLIRSLGPLTIDVGVLDAKDPDEPMPSLEYARKWLAEENERILNDAADFESMLDNAFEGQAESNDAVVEKGSQQFLGGDLKLQHSDSSSVISDTRSAPCVSVSATRRPLFPRKITDDVLTRRIARSNSGSSVPALPPVSPMSFLTLAQSVSPSESTECMNRRARSRSRTPDAVLDDIHFRKIYRSISQPGIDRQGVKAKPSPTTADYLRERTTEPLRQLRLGVTNTADMYHDDLAYRRLRKDVPNLPTDVVNLRQRSRSLDNIKSQRSPILRHRRPPDGKPTSRKLSEIKARRIRRTSLSKGVGNLVDLFDSSEDSGGKFVIRQSHSLPDLSGYRTELSVDFDHRGNIVSADPKYVQHARHPKKTPRTVKMKSKLRQRYSDSMDDSETGDSGERFDCCDRLQGNHSADSSDNPTSEGGLSGSEDASHEFEVRSTSLTSQSHDSDRNSDLETKRFVADSDSWGKQGAERFKRSPVIEPDVFIPRKQTDEKIKNWYKSHKESFNKRFSYFESGCTDHSSTRTNRYRITLRKSASQDNLTGAKVELQTRVQSYSKEAEQASAERAKRPSTLRMSYGSDPCLSEGRSRPPKHSDSINRFRSILHFTVPP